MKNTIPLILTGRQWDENGTETVTETRHTAEYYEKNGSIYLLYRELPEGMDTAVQNCVKYRDSALEITRKGPFRTRMVFRPDQEYLADYATPYGSVKIGIRTKEVTCLRSENSLTIRAEYTLNSRGQPFSRCLVTIAADLSARAGYHGGCRESE